MGNEFGGSLPWERDGRIGEWTDFDAPELGETPSVPRAGEQKSFEQEGRAEELKGEPERASLKLTKEIGKVATRARDMLDEAREINAEAEKTGDVHAQLGQVAMLREKIAKESGGDE